MLSKKDQELIKTLGVTKIGSKIYFTDFGTVIINRDSWKTTQELTLDSFVKKIESEINNNRSLIKYNKSTNKFYLVEKGSDYESSLAHELDINKSIMEEYVFGVFNNITTKVHNLYLKSMSTEEKQELLAKIEKETKEIIDKSDIRHELITPAEARMYLNYIEDQKRENDKVINSNRIAIATCTGITTTATVGLGTLLGVMEGTAFYTGVGAVLGACGSATVVDGFLTIVKYEDYLPIPGYTTFNYVKNKYKINKEIKERNKVITTKSKELYKIKNVDKINIANHYSVEEYELKSKPLNLQDSILKNIDTLLDKINLLNVEDKKKYLIETQKLLSEYTELYSNIVNQDETIIDIERDDYLTIKNRFLIRITDIESRVYETRQKDLKMNKISNETRLLTDKIEGFSELTNLDDEIKKIHNQSVKKVKVKKLKDNKKA